MTDPDRICPQEKPVTGEGERIAVLFVHGNDPLLMMTASSPELADRFWLTVRESADEALAGVYEKEYDIIVSACHLPDMDGISFLRKARQRW